MSQGRWVSDRFKTEEKLLEELKEILLKEDREELEDLKRIIHDRALLSEKVSPIIEERLDFFREHFPIEFHKAVEKIIDQKLKASQKEILDIIYPAVGKMIRKYIAHQFQMLKENIDDQLRRGWMGRFRSMFSKVKESDLILGSLDSPNIEEVYVIDRESGLLIGSASLHETIDKELIAGMLTAIKAFVEDAFRRGEEGLELIQYDTYQILIQDFYTYYIAAAVSGTFTASQKDRLGEDLLNFAEKELQYKIKAGELSSNLIVKKKLEKYFLQKEKK